MTACNFLFAMYRVDKWGGGGGGTKKSVSSNQEILSFPYKYHTVDVDENGDRPIKSTSTQRHSKTKLITTKRWQAL